MSTGLPGACTRQSQGLSAVRLSQVFVSVDGAILVVSSIDLQEALRSVVWEEIDYLFKMASVRSEVYSKSTNCTSL